MPSELPEMPSGIVLWSLPSRRPDARTVALAPLYSALLVRHVVCSCDAHRIPHSCDRRCPVIGLREDVLVVGKHVANRGQGVIWLTCSFALQDGAQTSRNCVAKFALIDFVWVRSPVCLVVDVIALSGQSLSM